MQSPYPSIPAVIKFDRVVQTCSNSKATLFFLIIIILRPIWPHHISLSLQAIDLAQ